MKNVGDEEEGLRRHASAQDAKAAELAGRFDYCDAVSIFTISARSGIASAATADDYEIVMFAYGFILIIKITGCRR